MPSTTADAFVAEALTAANRRHRAAERQMREIPTAVGPGGKIVDARPYLRNLHQTQQHGAVFDAVDKNPEKYLKDPRPGWRYMWVDVRDHMVLGRIRSQQYKEITIDELLPDSDLPYVDGPLIKRLNVTHKGPNGGVFLYDLQLCACSPEVYEQLFKIRESMGMARVTQGLDKLRERANELGADITTDMSVEKLAPGETLRGREERDGE